MRIIFCTALLAITITWAKPRPQLPNPVPNYLIAAKILKLGFDRNEYGSFRYEVETSDGFRKVETGEIINPSRDDETLSVQGYYTYVGDDGKTYDVKYIADGNGFQPEGQHLPPSADVNKRPKLGVGRDVLQSLNNAR